MICLIVIIQWANSMKDEWKDIDSAPTDGRYLLLFGHKFSSLIMIGCYKHSQWYDENGFLITPTHWMELPLPPEIVSSEP